MNTHSTYSYGAAASGDKHQFTRRLGPSGVSLHGLQRLGLVSAASHDIVGRQSARSHATIGDSVYPAGTHDLTLPPIVPLAGSPRDSAFQI